MSIVRIHTSWIYNMMWPPAPNHYSIGRSNEPPNSLGEVITHQLFRSPMTSTHSHLGVHRSSILKFIQPSSPTILSISSGITDLPISGSSTERYCRCQLPLSCIKVRPLDIYWLVFITPSSDTELEISEYQPHAFRICCSATPSSVHLRFIRICMGYCCPISDHSHRWYTVAYQPFDHRLSYCPPRPPQFHNQAIRSRVLVYCKVAPTLHPHTQYYAVTLSGGDILACLSLLFSEPAFFYLSELLRLETCYPILSRCNGSDHPSIKSRSVPVHHIPL